MIAPDECPPNSLGARSTWGEGTRPSSPALPTAMRHDTALPQPWASRGVERGRGDAQGEGEPRGAPSWASHWRFVLAARHGRRAVLRLLGPPSARSSCEAPRWSWGRTVRVGGNARPGAPIPLRSVGHREYHPAATAARTMDRDRPDDLERALALCARKHTSDATDATSSAGRHGLGACSSQLPGASRQQSPEKSSTPVMRGATGGHPAHLPVSRSRRTS